MTTSAFLNRVVPSWEEITNWATIVIFAILLSAMQVAYCEPLAFADEPEPCPEGHVCIPDETAQRWHTILSHVQCMDNALDEFEERAESENLSLEFDEYRIIVTEDGQVFEKEEMITTLQWCDYEVEFHVRPNVSVSIQKTHPHEDPFWGFRLRVRLGVAVWPLAVVGDDVNVSDLTQTVVLLEPFYVGHGHIAAYGGLESFGVVLGVDLTNNLNAFGGVGARWQDAQVGPVFGLSLSFN